MTAQELHDQIDATSATIASKHARLTALPGEKQSVLHDEKRLVTLEKEESDLPETIARLEQRRVLLGLEREQALKTEARDRMTTIEGDLQTITSRITTRRTAFLRKVEELLQLIQDDYPDRQHASELHAEAEYLHEAYDAPWPQATAATALSSNDMNTLDAEFAKRYQLLYTGGRWKELTDALRTEKNRIAQKESDAHRRASSSQMVKMYTPPFTPGKI